MNSDRHLAEEFDHFVLLMSGENEASPGNEITKTPKKFRSLKRRYLRRIA
jgi:hypothetical protein